ncbi:MAG: hypothetical protein K2J66_02335 [Muribaculaceae bacterium]|nr:hypothetical protein [Muribaculaceae bacterium]
MERMDDLNGRFVMEGRGVIDEILAENGRRNEALRVRYEPLKGRGCCGERVRVAPREWNDGTAYIPAAMKRDKGYKRIRTEAEWVKLRCRYDFEYWAAKCVTIKDKTTGADIAFVPNAPQRRVLAALEDDRLAGKPLRMIILKARQWGGSTLVQLYMAWIQITQKENWNSLICAHVKDTAATIRGMFTKMLDRYPEAYWDGEAAPAFRPFERTLNTRVIQGRGCKVTLGSSENQDAVRGNDYSMAHLSEVAFWKDTAQSSPREFIRAVCGGINSTPLTMIVLESTANGIGNYFHKEWLRAKKGESDKRGVFVPWYEIEIYRKEVKDARALWESLDEYERGLWERGLTLEMIQWYHDKRAEYQSAEQMHAEYPTTDEEAFIATEHCVFNPEEVERMRADCNDAFEKGELAGEAVTGEMSMEGLRWAESPLGGMKIWSHPERARSERRYVVGVDVGGRSITSDWSVIVVIDRCGGDDGATAEVVAQWRGHCDHDILAWKAVQAGRYWGNALVVFESNTFESENIEGDPGLYILSQVKRYYPNIYHRRSDEGSGKRIGFHTNRATKSMIINGMIARVRERGYIERDEGALNELLTYQVKNNGSYGAQEGCHDDMLMARAIALHVASGMPAEGNDGNETRYYSKFW